MPKRYKPDDILVIFSDLTKESDRAAIPIGCAWLEYGLESLIKSSLRKPKNAEERGILFSENGLFGTLSEKINGAYFMNLIGPETRKQCHIIRCIRNEVAHNMNSVSFESQHIINQCRELSSMDRMAKEGYFKTELNVTKEKEPLVARLRFISAVSLIAIQSMIYGNLDEMSDDDRLKYEEMKQQDGLISLFLKNRYISL